jgi:non-canonical purine NTP pyrophosphatase (RdgB/HAM1 family)
MSDTAREAAPGAAASPERLLFVSSNTGKVREVEAILRAPVERLAHDLPEIQALDVAVVAREKARAAFAYAGQPVLVEDTGLSIDALNGLPGALVRWFLVTIGLAGICGLIPPGAPRGARAKTAVAVCTGQSVRVFSAETPGEIALHPAGTGGFGWDPIFRPAGAARTFAEMDEGEKSHFSMRRQALEQLRLALENGALAGLRV